MFEGLSAASFAASASCFSIRNRIELFEGTRATRANHRTADVSVSATGSNCLKAVNTDDAALLIDRSFSIRNRIELFEGRPPSPMASVASVSVSATGSNCLKAWPVCRIASPRHRVSVSATGSNCLKAPPPMPTRTPTPSFSIRNRIELFEGHHSNYLYRFVVVFQYPQPDRIV